MVLRVCVWGGGCLSVVACTWRSVETGEVGFPLPPWGFQGSGLRLNSSHLEASGKCYNYWEPEICINVANVPH